MILLLAVALPIVTGSLLPVFRLKDSSRTLYLMISAMLTTILVGVAVFAPETSMTLFSLNKYVYTLLCFFIPVMISTSKRLSNAVTCYE